MLSRHLRSVLRLHVLLIVVIATHDEDSTTKFGGHWHTDCRSLLVDIVKKQPSSIILLETITVCIFVNTCPRI
ncbi:hypothetical protein GGU10DRAFT_364610, partial [Lentinula aff. detonsa]